MGQSAALAPPHRGLGTELRCTCCAAPGAGRGGENRAGGASSSLSGLCLAGGCMQSSWREEGGSVQTQPCLQGRLEPPPGRKASAGPAWLSSAPPGGSRGQAEAPEAQLPAFDERSVGESPREPGFGRNAGALLQRWVPGVPIAAGPGTGRRTRPACRVGPWGRLPGRVCPGFPCALSRGHGFTLPLGSPTHVTGWGA